MLIYLMNQICEAGTYPHFKERNLISVHRKHDLRPRCNVGLSEQQSKNLVPDTLAPEFMHLTTRLLVPLYTAPGMA